MANEPVFAIPPNGRDPIGETNAYLTDVFTSHDGHEQRVQLRGRPQLSLEYAIGALDGATARAYAALLEGAGAGEYLVPLWQYPRRLSTPAARGATALSASLAGLPRLPQGATYRFVLYSPATGTSEDVTASAWTDTTITLVGTLASAWASGSWIYPALVGYLPGTPGRKRINPGALGGSVAFDLGLLGTAYAAGAHTAAIYTPAGYLGADVLTGFSYVQDPAGETYNRRVSVAGGQAGKRSLDAQDPMAGWTRTLLLKCDGTDAVEALRAFLDARRGRALPFWLPTWDEDLTLAAGAAAEATEISIACPADVGYDRLLWPPGECRRYLQLWTWGSSPSYHHVTGIGTAALGALPLTISPPLPAAITTACRVSFLRYCRLDTDAPKLAWQGPAYAECELPMRELTQEYPA